MSDAIYRTEAVIAGGGLAGLVTAYELLDAGKRVLLIDKDKEERFGGLARESFGGIMVIGTPEQKKSGIPDSPDLAYRDWLSYAEFGENDEWPRKWARFYCDASIDYIDSFVRPKGIKFMPIVNWPERGALVPGNSVPRWHIIWGTGHELVVKILAALESHPRRDHLRILFEHEVSGFDHSNGRVSGVHGMNMQNGAAYRVEAEHVVVAAGGMCGGDLSKVRENWHPGWGDPPEILLNGAHDYGDGMLLDRARDIGANVTHLDKQWHYAAGVHHPAQRRPHDGISLVPPRGALWVNALGERIRNPQPIVGYTDTRHLVESILQQPGKYSWQVMNWKIAIKELAVSGCRYMDAFLKKSYFLLLKSLVFGNTALVNKLIADCPNDFAVAHSLPELVDKMNERNLNGLQTSLKTLENEIQWYDREIEGGPAYFNDDQLRRIMNSRAYRGDRLRMCKFQKIADPKAMPFIAIREFILSRKSLGGMQTDLDCRVLRPDGEAIPGLYAAGESAGFGGGGSNGLRSLEGSFLGGCILTGRRAGQAIAKA